METPKVPANHRSPLGLVVCHFTFGTLALIIGGLLWSWQWSRPVAIPVAIAAAVAGGLLADRVLLAITRWATREDEER